MPPVTVPLILVVDDDTRTARRLAQLLREDGYGVEIAQDGALAVGRLSREPFPDVVITDVQLPHVDGAAVARFARAGRPDVGVIFVTGYPELVDAQPDEPRPRAVVFTKPLDYNALCAELTRQCTLAS
jgi:CheY-like chemotaxis protein